jgi:hypothetical protein
MVKVCLGVLDAITVCGRPVGQDEIQETMYEGLRRREE